jgi:hypothetical protein
MVDVPINYIAVIVAAVVNMILGFLWFGPLFGKKWMALMGITQQQMDEMKTSSSAKNKMMMSYGIVFVGALVMAFVLAHSLIFAKAYLQVSGVSAGLMAGFWSWLGFIAPVTLGSVLWEKKPWMLWVLNNAYWLIGLLLMGLILSYWM